ncbi:hypothetical protein ABZX68_06395 [Streptomyces cellulosae]
MTAPAPAETLPAAGSSRRLQAMGCAGWPLGRLARETGLTPYRITQLATGQADTVTVDEARAIAAVYARYSGASPGLHGVSHIHASAARDRATALGWAPPAAWDDDTIDDPAAIPQWTGYCGSARGADLHLRHGLPMCPPCKAADDRRRRNRALRAQRGLSITRA